MSCPPMTLTSATIVGNSTAGGHTIFSVQVVGTSVQHTVQRRFSDFMSLHEVLQQKMPQLPKMPPKSVFRKRLFASFREDRQQKLGELLTAMVAADPHLSVPELRAFLSPEAQASQPETSTAESSQAAVPVAEEREAPGEANKALGEEGCQGSDAAVENDAACKAAKARREAEERDEAAQRAAEESKAVEEKAARQAADIQAALKYAEGREEAERQAAKEAKRVLGEATRKAAKEAERVLEEAAPKSAKHPWVEERAQSAGSAGEQVYNILSDPDGYLDLILADVFSFLPFDFIGVLCCVSSRWRRLGQDSSWKPDLLLYSWGDGKCNGHGEESPLSKPTLLQRFYSPHPSDQIVSVACSDFVTLALSASGCVYRWGHMPGNSDMVLRPDKISALADHKISQIAVSCPGYYHARAQRTDRHHAAALTSDGSLWMWGHNDLGQLFLNKRSHPAVYEEPQHVDIFSKRGLRVLRVSCGVALSVIQTEDRDQKTRVYGTGPFGKSNEDGFFEVAELENKTLKQLACGGFFACAIDGDNQLWTWGSIHGADNSNGNLLGHGVQHYRRHIGGMWAPAKVVDGFHTPVKLVVASSYTCLAVTEDGHAYTWGDSDGGALGHEVKRCHQPVPVNLPEGSFVSEASLAYTNGAVATSSGKLFMWGGRCWLHGISSAITSDSDGEPREMAWHGLASGYRYENLVLGHNHAFVIARKLKP
eukprot:gnl/TRDRNA2_/TRDRNA2_95095_c0_seq1.p1 gnl/TRDRNA2_/TRDRNA2_95095_c0~~gnl/TRDRNA2_/TRDRNA2_95095_c0_seq1.p1  ORF type:complete len:709 (-),score=125.18 gnl/TRDRNA2_/TRDRNA2_95095_c0_seq1:29-2155(-)